MTFYSCIIFGYNYLSLKYKRSGANVQCDTIYKVADENKFNDSSFIISHHMYNWNESHGSSSSIRKLIQRSASGFFFFFLSTTIKHCNLSTHTNVEIGLMFFNFFFSCSFHSARILGMTDVAGIRCHFQQSKILKWFLFFPLSLLLLLLMCARARFAAVYRSFLPYNWHLFT